MTFNNSAELLLRAFIHEIRNPLTTLYSTLQLIETLHPEVKKFKYWSSLAFDIAHINLLIDDFSNFTKSEHLNMRIFDLRAALEHLSLSFAASIASSEVEFTSEIDPSIHQITGDKTKLQEVFWNLLKNAYEAATPNSSIFFGAKKKKNQILFLIKDTGCGISDTQIPFIFDPFVTYKKGGSGLGLAISKRIIEAHEGSISVTSSPSVGTTFYITIRTQEEHQNESSK